jgi:nanoRNase/pAp phosphatase (c-di-AMP/oligoRNAs hydrolase)
MMALIDHCRLLGVDEILSLDDVRERVELYGSCDALAKEQIHRCSSVHGNLVVLDLRREETIYPTNRFMIYALFPACNISMHVMWGKQKLNTVFALGASIFNRTCATNIGELCLRHNGGGHAVAGTCQAENHEADAVLRRLIDQITGDDETPMLEVSAVDADSVAFD